MRLCQCSRAADAGAALVALGQDDHLVAAGFLGVVHRHVGEGEDVGGVLGGGPERHRADAGGHAPGDPVEGRGVGGDPLDDESGHPRGVGLVAVGEQDGELVAAEPGDDVGAADRTTEQPGDGDEELVAGVVPEACR